MKRSEAIKIIAEKYFKINVEMDTSAVEYSMQNTEYLLSLIEKEIGMIPPRHRTDLYDIHAWEEENE